MNKLVNAVTALRYIAPAGILCWLLVWGLVVLIKRVLS